MAKYDPLQEHIDLALDGPFEMTFTEIEQVLRFPLPDSARRYDEWWTDKSDGTSHVQAKAWLNVGRRVERVDRNQERVWFTARSGSWGPNSRFVGRPSDLIIERVEET